MTGLYNVQLKLEQKCDTKNEGNSGQNNTVQLGIMCKDRYPIMTYGFQ